jgi:mono/diheme cytochrome c family protein
MRKPLHHSGALLLATGLALPAGRAAAAPDAVAEGRSLAEGLCARCHAIAPNRPNRWTDAPSFESIANRPGMTRTWLVDFIPKPHMHMSAWNYNPTQVDSIAAYILSLRRR